MALIAQWIDDPNSKAFKLHLARIPDYFWVAEDGLKVALIGHNRNRESVRLTHTRSRFLEHRFFAYISVSAGRVARQHRVGFGGPDRDDLITGTDNWDADLFFWKKSSDPSRKVKPTALEEKSALAKHEAELSMLKKKEESSLEDVE
ncbi:hypothetical protein AHAS_Ahas05G0202400 [Arachis hypogaea]